MRSILDDFVAAVIAQKPSDLVKFGAHYFTMLRDSAASGGVVGPAPLVLAGPSGVGKGTLVAKLMKSYPHCFGFSVSHTTRAPRPGEENGIHYHFVPKSEFEIAVKRNEFIEYATVHTSMYGTSIKAVDSVRIQNKICILDIDIQGVQNVKKSSLECKYLFIAPPSMEELESRLRGRGTETEDKILIRLENATKELAYGNTPGNFDTIIVNNDLDETFELLLETVKGWYPDMQWDTVEA